MFSRSAAIYDAIYAFKDYAADASRIRELIARHGRSPSRTLLDVACGTGKHLEHLREHFEVEGLDLDPQLLAVARQRLPGVPLHQADMTDFDLGRRLDILTCLFSAVGYVKTTDRLRQAIGCMSRHLNPGGLLLVEPWFRPQDFHPGSVHAVFIDQPELKIARINLSRVEGSISILDFHYLVGTPQGVEHFTEQHDLGLFTEDEYMAAFEAAGLATTHDPQGLTGRGLYIGVKPA